MVGSLASCQVKREPTLTALQHAIPADLLPYPHPRQNLLLRSDTKIRGGLAPTRLLASSPGTDRTCEREHLAALWRSWNVPDRSTMGGNILMHRSLVLHPLGSIHH